MSLLAENRQTLTQVDFIANFKECQINYHVQTGVSISQLCSDDTMQTYYNEQLDRLNQKLQKSGYTYDPATKKYIQNQATISLTA